MSMNVPDLKQTSVTPTLSVPTPKDSIYVAASVDIRAMAGRVKASRYSLRTFHFRLFNSTVNFV